MWRPVNVAEVPQSGCDQYPAPADTKRHDSCLHSCVHFVTAPRNLSKRPRRQAEGGTRFVVTFGGIGLTPSAAPQV